MEDKLLSYLDNFTTEDEPEPVKALLGWKFLCKAFALLLTAPVWGPLVLLVFGIDRIAQLWPKKSKEPNPTPHYGLHITTENGEVMTFTLNAPPRRAFVDHRGDRGQNTP